MRRLIELSRYVVAVPAIGTIIGSFVLMLLGVWEIGVSIVNLVNHSVSVKQSVVGILTAVDTLLLATVLLVIGYGLYELFVDSSVQLPDWLEIRSLDDLKSKLIGVVVAIIAVVDRLRIDKLRMKYANYAALGVISPSVGELGWAL